MSCSPYLNCFNEVTEHFLSFITGKQFELVSLLTTHGAYVNILYLHRALTTVRIDILVLVKESVFKMSRRIRSVHKY